MTSLIQVTNVSPLATKEQLQNLFSYVGKVIELVVYPQEDRSDCPSKVCYVRFSALDEMQVSLHLFNTVFLDRALIIFPMPTDVIPDEQYAFLMRAPADTTAGVMPRTADWPPDVISMVIGKSGEQMIHTLEPRMCKMGLPTYPPLPSTTDANKVEEIRRTVLVTCLSPFTTADKIVEFFSQAGVVRYARLAGPEVDRAAYVEFHEQKSLLSVFSLNGASLDNKTIKVQHASCAIIKPANFLQNVVEPVSMAAAARSTSQGIVPPRRSPEHDRDRKTSRSRRHRSRSSSNGRRRRSRSRSAGSRRRRRSRERRSSRSKRSRSRSGKRRGSRRTGSRDRHRRRSHSRSRSAGRRSGRNRRGSRSKSRDADKHHSSKRRSEREKSGHSGSIPRDKSSKRRRRENGDEETTKQQHSPSPQVKASKSSRDKSREDTSPNNHNKSSSHGKRQTSRDEKRESSRNSKHRKSSHKSSHKNDTMNMSPERVHSAATDDDDENKSQADSSPKRDDKKNKKHNNKSTNGKKDVSRSEPMAESSSEDDGNNSPDDDKSSNMDDVSYGKKARVHHRSNGDSHSPTKEVVGMNVESMEDL